MNATDYRTRSPKSLGDSGTPNLRAKMTEALGCHMYIEEDALKVDGDPTGGKFKLQYKGYQTEELDWDASDSDIQTALEALTSIGAGNVTCTGGSLPDDSIDIAGDDIDPSEIKPLYGKLTGGDFLSFGSGFSWVYCAVLDESAEVTFEVVNAWPIGLHYARGTRAMVLKVGNEWLLADCGGTWYALPHDLANIVTNGLEIEFTDAGPAGVHKAENDSDDDPESDWTEARELVAHPYNGTWRVYPKGCG